MLKVQLVNAELFGKIKTMSNPTKFKMLELTQSRTRTITELSRETNLAYNKCADYVAELHRRKLVQKTKKGREMLVKSTVLLKNVQL